MKKKQDKEFFWATRREYKPDRSMQQALERTKEMYPEQKGFISTGGIGNNVFPEKR